jgi:hypothetical protein
LSTDVLMFVEDPGAANWAAAIAPALGMAGYDFKLVADGFAVPYLANLSVTAMRPPTGAPVEAAATLLDLTAPRSIAVGTSENFDTLGLTLIAEARRRGVPSLAFVDQAANAAHRFRGRTSNPMAYAPDALLLPNESARTAFEQLGFPGERMTVTGHPHFDRLREIGRRLEAEGRVSVRARLFPKIPADQPLIIFLAEVGYVVNPEGPDWERSFTLKGRGPNFLRGGATYRTAIVLEELLDALHEAEPRAVVVVRPHPKNAPDEFAAYRDELAGVSEGSDPLEAVFAADLVVGMTTALLEEAWGIGCRTLAILPRAEERAWLQAVADGKINSVVQRVELIEAAPRLLHGPPPSKRELYDGPPVLDKIIRVFSQQLAGTPVHG